MRTYVYIVLYDSLHNGFGRPCRTVNELRALAFNLAPMPRVVRRVRRIHVYVEIGGIMQTEDRLHKLYQRMTFRQVARHVANIDLPSRRGWRWIDVSRQPGLGERVDRYS